MQVIVFPDSRFARAQMTKRPLDDKNKFEKFREINVITPFLIYEDNIFDRKINYNPRKTGLGMTAEDVMKNWTPVQRSPSKQQIAKIKNKHQAWSTLSKKLKRADVNNMNR